MVNTVLGLIQNLEENHLDQIGFRWMNYQQKKMTEISYRQFVYDVKKFAGYLTCQYANNESIQIGLLGSNSYEYAVCLIGCFLAKVIPVTFNVQEGWNVIQKELEMVQISKLYFDPTYLLRENITQDLFPVQSYEMKTVLEYPEGHEVVFTEKADPEQLGMVMFTSGTTGINKAVMLSFKNVCSIIGPATEVMTFNKVYMNLEHYNALFIVPMYHVSGLHIIFSQLSLGETSNFVVNMKYLMKDLVNMPSQYTMVPPVVVDLFYDVLKKGNLSALGELRVIFSAGAGFDHSKSDLFKKNGFLLIDAYGLTETTGMGTVFLITEENDEYRRLHSIGKARNGCQIGIIQDEICFKGDCVLTGYYGNQQLTDEVIDQDRWFHTGDLGYLDEEGYVFITGRKKNLIILDSGENVSPEELEGLILQNNKVIECLVKEKNKKITAEIYCNEEDQSEISEFIRKVNQQLALYKRIGSVEFKNEPFEKNAMGKTKR